MTDNTSFYHHLLVGIVVLESLSEVIRDMPESYIHYLAEQSIFCYKWPEGHYGEAFDDLKEVTEFFSAYCLELRNGQMPNLKELTFGY